MEISDKIRDFSEAIKFRKLANFSFKTAYRKGITKRNSHY